MEFGELAALMRAVARLHPEGGIDRDLVRALSRLIARYGTEERPAKRPRAEETKAAPSRSTGGRAAARPETDGSPAQAPPPGAGDSKRKGDRRGNAGLVAIESVLQMLTEHADLVAEQQRSVSIEIRDRRSDADIPALPPPVEALFPAGRVRAILREISTVPAPSGRPDLAAAVKLIANGRAIRVVPQVLISALPQSIFWLFDAGPSMLPYSRDKQQLARTVIRLLGDDRVRIGDFIADPQKGMRPRGQVKWLPLHWPGRQSAVVVVGDLGIGDAQMIEARAEGIWRSFLDEAGRRGVSTVLLNPYEHERWPAVALGFDIALTWDVRTGVQALRRTRRSGNPH